MDTPSVAPDFAAAHQAVIDLCGRFETHTKEVMADDYKEDAARNEYITPFFEALGWDVRNTAHRSVYEKDVVTEKRVDIAGTARSADYAFRRPGTHLTAFFVEAKKPSVDIRTHAPCYQAVLYGWNASTPLVVLTDFEQLLILDARSRPDKHNATRHVLRAHGAYRYTDFRDEEKFGEIWGLLARGSVGAGSLEKAAAALPKLSGRIHKDDLFARGTRPVDEEFLAQMELWREKLAKSLKRANHGLDGERLTSLTQRILDRLVFLRFLEDRSIERDVTFAALSKGGSAWHDFLEVSKRLNARYNGIIYRKDPDGCEDPALVVDDTMFAGVVDNLVPENSEYLFGSISVTILGSIYERFLGNVIVARDRTAIVEAKPEVRKAGGVYYTPDYIVRYIVEQTVGRCLEGKKPGEVEKLRFADIACGSGSFLVEVFACLIRWHLAWYLADGTEKWAKKGVLRQREIDGDHVLTLVEKRKILLANVYGVDLDPQAVEVTQLSLYLKLMEDESFPSTQSLFDFEKHALLPDLRENVLCGNSLIETDIGDLFGIGVDEQEAIRPLDFVWQFPKVFPRGKGAFDAIVGNPPYLNVDDIWGKKDYRLAYLKDHYTHVYRDKTDILFYFFARAMQFSLRVGYIVSRAFLQAYKADKLRFLLLSKGGIQRIVDFQNEQIFPGVGITTCLVFLDRAKSGSDVVVDQLNSKADPQPLEEGSWMSRYKRIVMPFNGLSGEPWQISEPLHTRLHRQIDTKGVPLGEVLVLGQGMQTGRNDVFGEKFEAEITYLSLPREAYKERIRNSDVQRYHIVQSGEFLIYPNHYSRFSDLPKPAQEYLRSKRTALEERAAFQRGNCEWWRYTWPLHEDLYGRERIICPYLATTNRFAIAPKLTLSLTDTTVLFDNKQPESLKYLLALLNSKLLTFRFASIGKMKSGGVLEYFWNSISKIPIRRIDFSRRSEKESHDKVVALVSKMLAAKKAESSAVDGVKREHALRKTAALDRQIDSLVYELYGLTDEEIALVEGEG